MDIDQPRKNIQAAQIYTRLVDSTDGGEFSVSDFEVNGIAMQASVFIYDFPIHGIPPSDMDLGEEHFHPYTVILS